MRLAAYQFGVTGNVGQNIETIKNAVVKAAQDKSDFIVFPECAVSGYPPRDMKDSRDFNHESVQGILNELQEMADKYDIGIIVGTIAYDGDYYNRAYFISTGNENQWYDKRALYGWDEENFTAGKSDGIFSFKGINIGVRICFEIRFPEYFRELYKAGTDLDIVLFSDTADKDNFERYQLIKGHLETRAVENVTPILSVNSVVPYQTAPTCFINASGYVMAECERGMEEMLTYDFEKASLNFGELGRKRYSDLLLGF